MWVDFPHLNKTPYLLHDTRLKNNTGSEILNEAAEWQWRRFLLAVLEDIRGCFPSCLESQTFMEEETGSVLLLSTFFIISSLLKTKKSWRSAAFQRLQKREKTNTVKITHFCFHEVLPQLFIFLKILLKEMFWFTSNQETIIFHINSLIAR